MIKFDHDADKIATSLGVDQKRGDQLSEFIAKYNKEDRNYTTKSAFVEECYKFFKPANEAEFLFLGIICGRYIQKSDGSPMGAMALPVSGEFIEHLMHSAADGPVKIDPKKKKEFGES